jgi:Methylamine utilisation protein MauE
MTQLIVTDSAALILLSAFMAKLIDRRQFIESVQGYRLVPSALAVPAAFALMILELAVGVSLIARVAPRGVLVATGALFCVFAAGALLIARRRPDDEVDCGCLGALARLRLSGTSAAINGAVAAACLGAALPESRTAGAMSVVVAALLAVLVALAYWLTLYATSVLARVSRIIGGGAS